MAAVERNVVLGTTLPFKRLERLHLVFSLQTVASRRKYCIAAIFMLPRVLPLEVPGGPALSALLSLAVSV